MSFFKSAFGVPLPQEVNAAALIAIAATNINFFIFVFKLILPPKLGGWGSEQSSFLL
jgi:hypothetical protein